MYRLLLLLIVSLYELIGQETEVIRNTKVYLYPNTNKNNIIGEIFPGSSVKKLKKDNNAGGVALDFYSDDELFSDQNSQVDELLNSFNLLK